MLLGQQHPALLGKPPSETLKQRLAEFFLGQLELPHEVAIKQRFVQVWRKLVVVAYQYPSFRTCHRDEKLRCVGLGALVDDADVELDLHPGTEANPTQVPVYDLRTNKGRRVELGAAPEPAVPIAQESNESGCTPRNPGGCGPRTRRHAHGAVDAYSLKLASSRYFTQLAKPIR